MTQERIIKELSEINEQLKLLNEIIMSINDIDAQQLNKRRAYQQMKENDRN